MLINGRIFSCLTVSPGCLRGLYHSRYKPDVPFGQNVYRYVTGLMLVISMFYTRVEIGERIGWYVLEFADHFTAEIGAYRIFQCNGLGMIISGFIAFGIAHTSPNHHPNQWQWYMITNAGLTLIVSILFFFFFPDNPTTAWFLSEEEKLVAVKRVQENQNGIETKLWKKSQFVEAMTDVRVWLFFFFAAILYV